MFRKSSTDRYASAAFEGSLAHKFKLVRRSFVLFLLPLLFLLQSCDVVLSKTPLNIRQYTDIFIYININQFIVAQSNRYIYSQCARTL